MKKAAININFDSLYTIINQHAYDKKNILNSLVDPCFFSVLDRFVNFSDHYGVPFTYYVIGKDLENNKVADRIGELHHSGHEIGNHSYSHISNLGDLSRKKIKFEVLQAHKIITDTLGGCEPRGFIAPAWSTSPRLIDILAGLNYAYDTSLFPSPLMPIIQLQLWLKSDWGNRKAISMFRKDFFGNFFGEKESFSASYKHPWKKSASIHLVNSERNIRCLPLPSIHGGIPIWHTWAFKLSEKRYAKWLRQALSQNKAFYLLTHPLDLLDPEKDLKGYPSTLLKFERMAVPLEKKMRLMRLALDIVSSECEIVTMYDLAQEGIRLES